MLLFQYKLNTNQTTILNQDDASSSIPFARDVDWGLAAICFCWWIRNTPSVMGDITNGILMLLTLGGCGIWTLIDLIRILSHQIDKKTLDEGFFITFFNEKLIFLSFLIVSQIAFAAFPGVSESTFFNTQDIEKTFNIGGFLLGLILGVYGVIIAYLTKDKSIIKSSWWGFGTSIALALILIVIIMVSMGYWNFTLI